MDLETVRAVISYARRCGFETIDITGGAPELNPHIVPLIEESAAIASRLMFRSNLSALNDGTRDHLMDLLRDCGAVIIASFPSLNDSQTDAQRGKGVFKKSVQALQRLNAMGYGQEGSGLELDLVSNPAGAFLPPSQEQTEKRFREVLRRKWGIQFNQLFNFANVPLGRFRQWLLRSGNLDTYLKKLAANFNPCAIDGLMCRTMVSISWDGYLYDCDFNLAGGLPLGGHRVHISEMEGPPETGSPIAVGDHCYTCTAGAGFT
jgi:radical SAM/Cys-rich protein